MKTITNRLIAITGALALGLTAAHAQSDGALLDALVKKGVLSDQEAEDVRADEAKDYNQTAASRLSISDHITNLKLYGDVRYRFEYLDEKPQNSSIAALAGAGNHANTTERYRYRVRVGADYTFTDNFKAGLELESNSANDSANQSIGAGYNKFSINVGLLYLQWKPTDWLTLTGGKQKNPLYTTDLVWDPDINPEGGSEQASWTLPLENPDQSFTVGVTAGQFIYADNSENAVTPIIGGAVTGTGVADKTDIWQFVEQVPVQFNWNKDTYIKVVPGFDSYTGGGNSGISASIGGPASPAGGAFGGGGALAFVGPHAADHLQIFTAPGEVDWKLWDIPFKGYWDFAYNTEGKARIQDVYLGNHGGNSVPGLATPTPSAANVLAQRQNQGLGDNIAWVAGLQVGQNKKKGDWSIKGDYRQVGLGAIDPNLNDSDWGDSFLNQQGVKIQSIYNFTDFLTGSLTYINTWDLKNGLFDGTNGQSIVGLPIQTNSAASSTTPGVAGIKSTERIEADIIWKF